MAHLWKALLVHMVHHDYLIIVAGGGTSWAGEGKTEKHEFVFGLKNMSEVCLQFH